MAHFVGNTEYTIATSVGMELIVHMVILKAPVSDRIRQFLEVVFCFIINILKNSYIISEVFPNIRVHFVFKYGEPS
jgi:hypothetical protein